MKHGIRGTSICQISMLNQVLTLFLTADNLYIISYNKKTQTKSPLIKGRPKSKHQAGGCAPSTYGIHPPTRSTAYAVNNLNYSAQIPSVQLKLKILTGNTGGGGSIR
jgi:hypothetical protein